jgi:two-component system, cell cycle sensor histidine kinase and response regulator CckA
MKILLAEDDEDSRIFLEYALTASSHEVKSAENGKEALKIAENFLPDLIISDILMPEMDGYELCRALQKDKKLQSIPFIFYTATYTDPKDEQFAMSLGASRFLVKPMEMPEFFQEIKKVMEENQKKCMAGSKTDSLNNNEVEKKYSEVLARKLDKKVQELEAERDKLQQSEQKYRRLVEAMRNNYFFFTRNQNGAFTYLSPSIKTMLGYSQEDFLLNYKDYLADPVTIKKWQVNSKLSRHGERQAPYEINIKHQNGSIRCFELTEEPIPARDQESMEIEGIAHDITELKQAEEERVRLASAIEQASETVYITDSNGNIQYINPAFEKLTGYTREEAIGNTPRIFKSDKHDQKFHKEMWSTLLGGKVWKGQVINKKKDGTLFEEEVSLSPVKNNEGKITNFVAVQRDVSREVSLEKQLRQAMKMEALGTLAGGIAHDFNNILSAILGYSQIAKLDLPDNCNSSKALEIVIESVHRATDLVKQILTFSRQGEEVYKPIKVQSIIKEVIKMLTSSLPSTTSLQENILTESGPILADPSQIHQILMNICTNAKHAIGEKIGTLSISLSKVEVSNTTLINDCPQLANGLYLDIEISDTGCGMDEATASKIFDPFFTTKEKGKGTGLGLAVVHGIITQHKGEITVNSELGKGTIFHIYLPIIEEEIKIRQAAEDEIPRGNEKILLVDDEEIIVNMMQNILETLGYSVRSFTSSIEAFEECKKNHSLFDLVITDMTMPEMNGITLAQKIFSLKPELPVLLCTGFNEIKDENRIQAKEIIKSFVKKPFDVQTLSKAVRKALAQD